MAGTLEKPSEHPFAKAILEATVDMHIPEVTEFETLPGRGVSGKVNGIRDYGGNRRLMEERGIAVPEYR